MRILNFTRAKKVIHLCNKFESTKGILADEFSIWSVPGLGIRDISFSNTFDQVRRLAMFFNKY